jgi:hypothetical protein
MGLGALASIQQRAMRNTVCVHARIANPFTRANGSEVID